MALLVRRVASTLKRSFGRSLVPFLEATEAIARDQAVSLHECAVESARVNDAMPSTSFDVYLSFKVSDVGSATLKTIHQALTHAGHRLCQERLQLRQPADVAGLILRSRRFVLLLTANMFKSFWVMRELHDAILTGADIVLVLIEGERWGGDPIPSSEASMHAAGNQSLLGTFSSQMFEPVTSRPEVNMALSAISAHFPDAPETVYQGVERIFGREYQTRVVHQSSIYADSFALLLIRMVGVPLSIRQKLDAFDLQHDQHLEAAMLLHDVAEINVQDPIAECEVLIQTRGDPSSLTIVQRNRSDGRVLRHLSAANFLQYVDTCRAVALSRLAGFHESQGDECDAESIPAMHDESSRLVDGRIANVREHNRTRKLAHSRGPGYLEEELYLVTDLEEVYQRAASQSRAESELLDFDEQLAGFDVGLLNESTQLRQVLREALTEVIFDIKKQLKPLLAFVQIQGSFERPASSSTFKWPESTQKLIAVFKVFNLDFFYDGLRYASALTRGATNVANMTIFSVTVFGALLCGIYFGACAIISTLAHQSKLRTERFYDFVVKTMVLMIFVMYPTLSLEILKLYKTRKYGDFTILEVDWSLGYEDTSAPISLFGYQMIAVPFVCLWVVGVPVFFFAVLWRTARPHPKPNLNLEESKALEKLQVVQRRSHVTPSRHIVSYPSHLSAFNRVPFCRIPHTPHQIPSLSASHLVMSISSHLIPSHLLPLSYHRRAASCVTPSCLTSTRSGA